MTDNIKIGLLILILAVVSFNSYQISKIENIDIRKKVEVAPANSKELKTNPQIKPVTNPLINEAATGPLTTIFFDNEEKDFGKVNLDSENKYSFEFINNGSEPLKISNARGSCGCTVPEWPKHPIMPGQKGKIDVVYKPNKSQAGKPQQKTVTVTANTKPANTVLNIKAFVNPE
jgi:hypothetical protein